MLMHLFFFETITQKFLLFLCRLPLNAVNLLNLFTYIFLIYLHGLTSCRLVQTMDYSVIVFDTAPTGHTLRLLQFPSTLEKGLTKMMSLKNKFGGVISQVCSLYDRA